MEPDIEEVFTRDGAIVQFCRGEGRSVLKDVSSGVRGRSGFGRRTGGMKGWREADCSVEQPAEVDGYYLFVRSNSLITCSVRSMVSLL